MATIGGHGFGAKVAIATATQNLDRFTGVMCLDGGPLDHTNYEAFREYKGYLNEIAKWDIHSIGLAETQRRLESNIGCTMWKSIFQQNLSGGGWNFNLDALVKDVNQVKPMQSSWSSHYGLWPGQAWVNFPSYSRWVHLNSNTPRFYNVFPRLEGKFNSSEFNTMGWDESQHNHWMHITLNGTDSFMLANRMWRWLKTKDGANVLLKNKTEAGWYYVPDRGHDNETDTLHGEYIPEHVHHNYKNTNAYEVSRKNRGKEAATHNQFIQKGHFTPEDKWE